MWHTNTRESRPGNTSLQLPAATFTSAEKRKSTLPPGGFAVNYRKPEAARRSCTSPTEPVRLLVWGLCSLWLHVSPEKAELTDVGGLDLKSAWIQVEDTSALWGSHTTSWKIFRVVSSRTRCDCGMLILASICASFWSCWSLTQEVFLLSTD